MKDDILTLSMGEVAALQKWAGASFAVHPDCKSHKGLVSIMKGGKNRRNFGQIYERRDLA